MQSVSKFQTKRISTTDFCTASITKSLITNNYASMTYLYMFRMKILNEDVGEVCTALSSCKNLLFLVFFKVEVELTSER